jgi:serine kinase of HPr protein (carbohydrate metabolism regulator)
MTIHATTIAIHGRAVVIEGPSGSGKSDLALRLIDRGAMLVADDRTIVALEQGRLVARCPATIAGLIEVRGLGILAVPHLSEAPIALAVLCADSVARMPDPAIRLFDATSVPQVAVDPRAASAPILVELALARLGLRP